MCNSSSLGLTSRQMRVSSALYWISGGPRFSRRCLRQIANSTLRRRIYSSSPRPGWPGSSSSSVVSGGVTMACGSMGAPYSMRVSFMSVHSWAGNGSATPGAGALPLVIVILSALLHSGQPGPSNAPPQEQVRSHPRLKKEVPEGQRVQLPIGKLFVPKGLEREGTVPLFVHFHGGDWLPEIAAVRHGRTAVITVQLGTGSAVYG